MPRKAISMAIGGALDEPTAAPGAVAQAWAIISTNCRELTTPDDKQKSASEGCG